MFKKRNVTLWHLYTGFLSFENCHTHTCQETELTFGNYTEMLYSCHNVSYAPDAKFAPEFPRQMYIIHKGYPLIGRPVLGIDKIIMAMGGQTIQAMPAVSKKDKNNVIVLTGRVCLGNKYAFLWDRDNRSTLETYRNQKGIYNFTCQNCSVQECIGPKIDGRVFILTRPL